MKRQANLFVSLVLLLVFGTILVTAAGPYDKYLTAADVVSVSGLKGAKLIPKNPSIGAGGDLNFATSDNKLIVMVQVVGKSNYDGYKQYFFKAAVKGLGEQAMQGATMPGYPANLVAFAKGASCVALTAFGNPDKPGTNMLTVEQLIALAKIIAARM